MDQVKIGKFIAQCRKEQKLTQAQLAEKLNITDRAISKWETGNGMPDSSIMLQLCDELKITVNELLSGEVIKMDNYNVKGILSILPLIISTIIVLIVSLEESLASIILVTSLIPLLIATPFALKIEQTAVYYECKKCHNRYVPKYKNVFWAMHIGRTRYMKCPKCNESSWNKKVISK